jgi:hypothetical protein
VTGGYERGMKHLVIAILMTVACGKSKHIDSVPCDAKAVGDLAATLSKASGFGIDLTNDKAKADSAAAKTAMMGKQFAFTGCKFDSQGNDIVRFASSDSSASIECAMKGGEKGVTEFRHAAMKIGQDKLRLDVSGVIAATGTKDFPRVGMTDCEISTHD